jgi:glycosyltransferase involved in cell wall biosynthesis
MFDISLIIPTYGRFEEINRLLGSVAKQDYPLQKIEVIIVDQNESIDLFPVIQQFQSKLHIIHHKTTVKGIAAAKNTGIKLSKASIVTFPDDDCCYYEDTVSKALLFFKKHPDTDIIYGRIYDRQSNENIMRKWPDKNIQLNLYNFHLNYSAITCFSKQKEMFFDERFGAGTSYASGEELDYIIYTLKKKHTVIYTNTIDLWHPKLDLEVMPLNKIYGYARGYGAICRKHSIFPILFLFTKSFVYQVVLIFKHSLLLQKQKAIKHFQAAKGRLDGFMQFR